MVRASGHGNVRRPGPHRVVDAGDEPCWDACPARRRGPQHEATSGGDPAWVRVRGSSLPLPRGGLDMPSLRDEWTQAKAKVAKHLDMKKVAVKVDLGPLLDKYEAEHKAY